MYKEKGEYCFQLDYGDISRVWFLNVCKKGDEKNTDKYTIKNEKFRTKAEGLTRFKEVIKIYGVTI